MEVASVGATIEASGEASEPICHGELVVSDHTVLQVLDKKIENKKKQFKEKLDEMLKEKCISRKEVQDIGENLSEEITQIYSEQGYYTSRAKLKEVKNGIVTIQIIEGELANIDIENKEDLRLRESYIDKRLRRGADKPLNLENLESHLRLLQNDSLVEHLEASLKPKGESGKSDLSLRIKEANPFIVNVSLDNYSPPSIGSERFGIALGLHNLTGFGDQLVGSYYRSTTDGANLLDFSYRLPLNAKNGTLLLHGARYETKITQSAFADLNITAKKDLYEIHYRQPLIRTYRHELALSAGFTFQDGQTFVFENIGTPFGIGPDKDGKSRTSVIKFVQEYRYRGSKTVWSFRSQLNFGTGLFHATDNLDPIPDGKFFSWSGQFYQRIEQLRLSLGPIPREHTLIVQADVQLTPDSLLASEQFVIGGQPSVRGYRHNVRTGDNGVRFSLEDQITVLSNKAGIPYLQIMPFIDMGATWNVRGNPNKQQDQRFLIGAGLGLLWDVGQLWRPLQDFQIRLDYGYPFIHLADKGKNVQDKGFYFSVNYKPKLVVQAEE